MQTSAASQPASQLLSCRYTASAHSAGKIMRTISVRNPLSFLTGRTTRLDGTSPTVARHRTAGRTNLHKCHAIPPEISLLKSPERQTSKSRSFPWVAPPYGLRDLDLKGQCELNHLVEFGLLHILCYNCFFNNLNSQEKANQKYHLMLKSSTYLKYFSSSSKAKICTIQHSFPFFCNLTEYFRFDCFVRLVAHISNRSANIYGTCCASLAGALAWSA